MASSAYGVQRHGRPGGEAGEPVRLAREAPFRLGAIEVFPATRQLRHQDGFETIEPRVMQVLVLLARARGHVVSRDDLVGCCWDGRIVGEDAINRVIGRLRRLAERDGQQSFRIETVTKVGYRLVAAAEPEAPPLAPGEDRMAGQEFPSPSRRTLLRAAAAAAVALGPAAIWTLAGDRSWMPRAGHRPLPEARRFYDEGMKAQYIGTSATTDQAEAYFRQAAAADPEWADAWGSLAMSYRHMLDGETNAAQWRLVAQTRSAARRALALDPDNAEALTALALIEPPFRRWRQVEARWERLLRRFPRAFVLRGHLGMLLRDVGRFSAAIPHARIAVGQQPFIAFPSCFLALSYWGAGRLQEAEAELEKAARRWPKHPAIWFLRLDFLTYAGPAEAAVALAMDKEARPSELPQPVVDAVATLARAMATRAPAEIAAAAALHERVVRDRRAGVPPLLPGPAFLPFFAAIGDLDTAFSILSAHYFDRGPLASPHPSPTGALTQRDSYFLFMPSAEPLRRDKRFGSLLEALGLERYWRQTGTRPDFRLAPA